MNRQILLVAAALVLLSVTPVGEMQPSLALRSSGIELTATPAGALGAQPINEVRRTGTPKLQDELDRLADAYAQRGRSAVGDTTHPPYMMVIDDRVHIVVEGDVSRLAPELAALGGLIDSIAHDRLSLLAPIESLRDMAGLEGVQYVRLPLPAIPLDMPQVGDITSEGVAAIGADVWHAASITGQGVVAAVLDSGFYNWSGPDSLQTSGDLPDSTICIDLTSDCVAAIPPNEPDCDCHNEASEAEHGSACAEIVFDMAPGIETMYLFAFDDDADFGPIVDQMIALGVDVASLSWGWANGEPYDGSGPISYEVNRAKVEGDVFFSVASGNQRRRHWEGEFLDGNEDDWHEFGPGDNIYSVVGYQDGYVDINGRLGAHLTWNDWPTTDQDYDMYLMQWNESESSWEEYLSSERPQDGDDPPTESIGSSSLPLGRYALVIKATSISGDPEWLELTVMRQNADSRHRIEYSSILEPATASGAVAVGASRIPEASTELTSFSSMGPRNPSGGGAFDLGSCGATPTTDCKPDLIGPDGIHTVAYAPWRFGGTSAAAPHIAGAAALVKSANPSWTSDQVYSFLAERAVIPTYSSARRAEIGTGRSVGPQGTVMDPGWGWGSTQMGDLPGPIAVELVRFQAFPLETAIQVTWETAVEIDSLGFNLHRADSDGSPYAWLNADLIPSQSFGLPIGSEYTWLDDSVVPGETYRYRLEVVDSSGQSSFSGDVQATAAIEPRYKAALPLIMRK